ncbi:unnamed protein product [Periconia digitata]|uniref:Uncharacterized protein n=1 Tax=Periconia digitata TaxID=1303443 RepID=A0A9W4XRK2_9PLEO|nr:unnamed protein product [Periconia digitata]
MTSGMTRSTTKTQISWYTITHTIPPQFTTPLLIPPTIPEVVVTRSPIRIPRKPLPPPKYSPPPPPLPPVEGNQEFIPDYTYTEERSLVETPSSKPSPKFISKHKTKLLHLTSKATTVATAFTSTRGSLLSSSSSRSGPSPPSVVYTVDTLVEASAENPLPKSALQSALAAGGKAATSSFFGDDFAEKSNKRKVVSIVGKARLGAPGLAAGVAKAVVVGGVEGGKVFVKEGGMKKKEKKEKVYYL